ncbi:MAG: tetratricopeptide repeat protein [Phycisphaerae bacterium]
MADRRVIWAVCGIGTIFLPHVARGQIDHRIDLGRPGAVGRLYDANPGIGLGGYNAARPGFTAGLRANAVITGNVTGLGAFHGVSPVVQNNQFRDGLPSAGLAGFRRQSVGLRDLRAGRAPVSAFYFDPAQTVGDLGYIRRGLTRPGSSQIVSPNVRPPSVSSRRVHGAGGPVVSDPVDLRIEGTVGRPDIGGVVYRRVIPESLTVPALGGASVFDRAAQSSIFGPRLPALSERVKRLRTGARLDASALLGLRPVAEEAEQESGSTIEPGRLDGEASEMTFAPEPQAGPPSRTGGGVRAMGGDGLMRPGASADTEAGGEGVGAGARTVPGAAGPRRLSAGDVKRAASARTWAGSHGDDTVAVFVDRHRDVVARHLAVGDAALRRGAYYNAAREFDLAHTVDPKNPLPLLKRGHALAAAGDFVSAVRSLLAGIELHPQIAAIELDLPAMVGGRDTFDRRRVALEDRLGRGEDTELRFLLGYLEYYSGLQEAGLRDLSAAAKAAPADSIISRFPGRLPSEGG